MLVWPVGQGVKTLPSHGRNRGSIPLQAIIFLGSEPLEVRFFYAIKGNYE